MEKNIDNTIENVKYSVKCVEEVAIERHNVDVFFTCENLRSILFNLKDLPSIRIKIILKEIKFTLDRISSDLLSAVKFEMYEVLVPFIEVKKPTHEFGAQTFPDYFKWLSPEKKYTPEILVGILEEQEKKLTIARKHLDMDSNGFDR